MRTRALGLGRKRSAEDAGESGLLDVTIGADRIDMRIVSDRAGLSI